ncbi:kelch repeat protein, putative [Perkinsus marinus ATCC 50983]|uniref:Kelch repeat protein, putative n=1 Tax=Perkinsus marinus (strain ATCC 50983 / TXsc) TaxID=423536 RepID=C5KPU2_PERM5|nr:kelch repeat protein, putative [Perkinsus marinus ATCC 50983]EER13489.1 kelch repeat protein, putative [Perkinsus marinus ATCC 50983]|eukprot:XP_002781694.1 kelch repeat protein, putative [Perkinsus marinus ATCC 50983]
MSIPPNTPTSRSPEPLLPLSTTASPQRRLSYAAHPTHRYSLRMSPQRKKWLHQRVISCHPCGSTQCCRRKRVLNAVGSSLLDYTSAVAFATGWQRLPPGGFDGRSGHALTVCWDGNTVYLAGGLDSMSRSMSDVYCSVDSGRSWKRRTISAEWSPRMGHCMVPLRDDRALVLLGGWDRNFNFKNDVWRSTDGGRTWTEAIPVDPSGSFPPRCNFACAILHSGRIVVCGGLGMNNTHLNDVWCSDDSGESWQHLSACAPWEPRWAMGFTTINGGQSMIMVGGTTMTGFLSDVWRSDDGGVSWKEITLDGDFGPRGGMAVVQHNPSGMLVLCGGEITSTQGLGEPSNDVDQCSSDVWISRDEGFSWTKASTTTSESCGCLPPLGVSQDGLPETIPRRWQARCLVRCVALHSDRLLLVGGELRSEKRVNDAWLCTGATDAVAANGQHQWLLRLGEYVSGDRLPLAKRRRSMAPTLPCIPFHLWMGNIMPYIMGDI